VFNALARRGSEQQIEQVGRKLRGMMSWIDTEFEEG
jgi:ketol-acid reductoisomerase